MKIKITRAVVPSLFTILNMFCGYLSIIQSNENNFIPASIFILGAAFFDTFDGIMARLTKSSSAFGVQIDSLADVISFGIAPAFLSYKIYLFNFGDFGLLISSLLLIMAGIRLARFNVQLIGFDKDYFNGLPSPASAITIVAFILNFYDEKNGLNLTAANYFPFLVVLVSLLMVSVIRYDTLPKFSKKSFQEKPILHISIFFSIFLMLVTKGKLFFYIIFTFIFFGIIKSTFRIIKKQFVDKTEEVDELTSLDI